MGEKVKVRTEKEKQLQEATKYFIEKNVRDIKQFQQGFSINGGSSHHQQASLRLRKKQETFDWRRRKLLQNLDENGGDIPSELSLKQK